jgi:hypothetical protein
MSQRILLSSGPPFGDAAGGQTLVVQGMQLQPGSTATVAGDPVTVLNVPTANRIEITAPPLLPGFAHHITVTTPSGLSGTLLNGWVTRFTDVPGLHSFETFVGRMIKNGLTAGCGGGAYCVDQAVTRGQIAVFLLRGKEGLCFLPPACSVATFTDVPCSNLYSRWIYELVTREITGGCGPNIYCPDNAVTREQIAVFLLRTLEGTTYTPPPCVTPAFTDVPCTSVFAPWVNELVARGITGGCGGGLFCPTQAVTRGQVSVFLSVTFNLPL